MLEHLFQASGEQHIAHPAFQLIVVSLGELRLYPVGYLAKLEGELSPHDLSCFFQTTFLTTFQPLFFHQIL